MKRLKLEDFKLQNLKGEDKTSAVTNKLLGSMLSDCHDDDRDHTDVTENGQMYDSCAGDC